MTKDTQCIPASPAQWAWGIFFIASATVATLVLKRFDLPVSARVAMAVVTTVAGIVYVLLLARDMQRSDELQRRILAEATAVGCGAMFIALMNYPTLQRAGFVGEMNPPLAAGALVLFVAAGYFRAWRRYR